MIEWNNIYIVQCQECSKSSIVLAIITIQWHRSLTCLINTAVTSMWCFFAQYHGSGSKNLSEYHGVSCVPDMDWLPENIVLFEK